MGMFMGDSNRFHRRKFIQVTASAAVVGSMTACVQSKPGWNFFTPGETELITASCELIIPADQDPGAKEADVPRFIDIQLAGPYQHLKETYRIGLAGVDETSLTLFENRFVDLPFESQTEVLQSLESGQPPGEVWKTQPSNEFFSMLIDHTHQGFYGDPRHGGNRDAVSWTMLGVPYPPVRGRHHGGSSEVS